MRLSGDPHRPKTPASDRPVANRSHRPSPTWIKSYTVNGRNPRGIGEPGESEYRCTALSGQVKGVRQCSSKCPWTFLVKAWPAPVLCATASGEYRSMPVPPSPERVLQSTNRLRFMDSSKRMIGPAMTTRIAQKMPVCPSTMITTMSSEAVENEVGLSIDSLIVGSRRKQAIYDANGVKLLPADTEITSRFLKVLNRRRVTTVYLRCEDFPPGRMVRRPATSEPMVHESVRRVDSLTVGERLGQDLYDSNDVLLLAANSIITSRFLDVLRQRGIQTIRLRSTHSKHGKPEHRSDEPSEPDRPAVIRRPKRVVPRLVDHSERRRLSVHDLKTAVSSGLDWHKAASGVVQEVCKQLRKGRSVSGADIAAAVKSLTVMIHKDADLLPLIVSLRQSNGDYLYDHSVDVAMLSMSIAAQMGFSSGRIWEVGVCAFLQDVGMLCVPERIRLATRPLTTNELDEVRRHPLYTLELLQNLRGVPQTAQFVSYQAHERCDGTGYPRKLSAMNLLQYTKIISVADSYTAMCRPRPHRASMLPYEAAKTTLIQASNNKFDRTVVRAFLNVVSLFPVGSEIGLENGMRARVLRANPDFHTRPIVEEIDTDGNITGRIIDLSHEMGARISQTF